MSMKLVMLRIVVSGVYVCRLFLIDRLRYCVMI